ncbi:methyltransferase family protein [Pendulispora albinea]|uniref:Isoprenylcysteine carboxylmethyltransferase family protein n=1 Tax=Pendulispora albinea TaxID=2741071 RepID=A0ABZ2M3G5_9BACT
MHATIVLSHLRSFVLPLSAAILVPALCLEPGCWPPRMTLQTAAGAALILAGLAMLAWTVGLFARVGRGTLAPWEPTRKLVVVGPYAHVRNPMISGVFTLIVGEALFVASRGISIWAAVFFAVNHVYFVLSEEPGLVERFGAEYTEYTRHVPRWIPRRTGWHPGGALSGETSPPTPR